MKKHGQGRGKRGPGKQGKTRSASGAASAGAAPRERDAIGRKRRREVRARERFLAWRSAQPVVEPLWFTRELQRIVQSFCRRHHLSDNAVAVITVLSQPTVAKALRGRGEGVCHTLDVIIIRLGMDAEVIAKLLRVRARSLRRAKG